MLGLKINHVSKSGHRCAGKLPSAAMLTYTYMAASLRYTITLSHTVYPKKYAHGFVVLCFVVVMQLFIMNSHEVFIQIHQGCFAGTGAIVRLPQCQWSKPDGYGKISQCITTTKHSKTKTVCIFLGIYCISKSLAVSFGHIIVIFCVYWSMAISEIAPLVPILSNCLRLDRISFVSPQIIYNHHVDVYDAGFKKTIGYP